MESRGPEDFKNVKTSQAYFFEGFISFFEDFSLTTSNYLHYICKRSSTFEQAIICFGVRTENKHTCFQRECKQDTRL